MRISAEDFARRLRAVVLSSGGTGLPRRRRDKHIFLRAAAQSLPFDETGERALTDFLADWLERLAPWMGLDAVTLRREMVDEGYLERDAAGSVYRVIPAGRGAVEFDAAVAELDAAALIAAERAAIERKRSEWGDC